MSDSIGVLFFFHMHQPFYRVVMDEPLYPLPWVFMHSIREYYDVARLIDEIEELKLTVNFVPSLLFQIEDYSKGNTRDIFLEHIKKPANELDEEEKTFILKNFFSAHPQNQIGAFHRYRELQVKRGNPFSIEMKVTSFSTQDVRDLQVLFLLSHISIFKRDEEPGVREIIDKGRNYTEDDKYYLLLISQKILGDVIPLYKKLMEEGRIEISLSPYYHPLLPLIFNTDIAREIHPHMKFPSPPYRDEENLRNQVERGIKYMEEKFGVKPKGIWPPEGAISDEVVLILRDYGFEWTLSDEAVLERSIGIHIRNGEEASTHLYRAYEIHGMKILFRDRFLSDRIGFVYGNWKEEEAVEDFMSRVKRISNDPSNRVLLIALDGENPWVNYRDGGIPFLRRLFHSLISCENVFLEKISSFLGKSSLERIEGKLFPGTWASGMFTSWIGHPEKNLAWDYLRRVKGELGEELGKNSEALEFFLRAQGSDWFWWFGEDHPSLYSGEFDRIFRNHLMNCYRTLSKDIPPFLKEPIKKLRISLYKRPLTGKIKPVIDGKVTNYFEWLSALEIDLSKSQMGTMEKVEWSLSTLFFGVDEKNLYLRVDGRKNLKEILRHGISLHFHFLSPPSELNLLLLRRGEDIILSGVEKVEEINFALEKILEISIPLKIFNKNEVLLSVSIEEEGMIVERYPFTGFFVLSPLEFDEKQFWSV
jgi:alpha-amylase/alpha-mannosidase (GH57 family)